MSEETKVIDLNPETQHLSLPDEFEIHGEIKFSIKYSKGQLFFKYENSEERQITMMWATLEYFKKMEDYVHSAEGKPNFSKKDKSDIIICRARLNNIINDYSAIVYKKLLKEINAPKK